MGTIASSSCAGNTLKLWRVKHGDCLYTFVHDDYVTDFVGHQMHRVL